MRANFNLASTPLFLRALGLCSKAFFLIIGVRILNAEDYLTVSFLLNLVILLTFFIGLESYHSLNRASVSRGLIYHSDIHLRIFIAVPVLLIGAFPLGLYMKSVSRFEYFYLILLWAVLEYISLEMIRILVIFNDQMSAALGMLLKTFPLALFAFYFLYFDATATVFQVGIFSSLIALTSSVFCAFKAVRYMAYGSLVDQLSISLKRTILASLPFFAASIFFRMGFVVERDLLFGLSEDISKRVANYIYLWNGLNGSIAVIDAAIFTTALPVMLMSSSEDKNKHLMLYILLSLGIKASLVLFFLIFDRYFMGGRAITVGSPVLLVAIVCSFVQILTGLLQIKVYATGNDRTIWQSNLIFLLGFLVATLLLPGFINDKLLAIAFSMFIAFLLRLLALVYIKK